MPANTQTQPPKPHGQPPNRQQTATTQWCTQERVFKCIGGLCTEPANSMCAHRVHNRRRGAYREVCKTKKRWS